MKNYVKIEDFIKVMLQAEMTLIFKIKQIQDSALDDVYTKQNEKDIQDYQLYLYVIYEFMQPSNPDAI